MKRLRVLYVSPNSSWGGAETLTAEIARTHDRSKVEPVFLFFRPGPMQQQLASEGFECHLLKSGPPRLRNPVSCLRCVVEIESLLNTIQIDWVHSVMGYAHLFAGLAAKRRRVPAGWFQHGPTGRLDWLTGRVPARVIWLNSRHTRSEQERYQARTQGYHLVYPGVRDLPPPTWNPPGQDFRRSLGFPENTVLVGLIGRISPMKGHPLLLEALSNADDSLRAIIVGAPFMPSDHDYLRELQAQTSRLRLQERVRFTGSFMPPFAAMAACDIVTNCTVTAEPFGLTVVEAMLLEKAVVVPAAGGPLEIVEDGRTGLLFRPGSSQDLAEKLALLAKSREQRERLGQSARQAALRRFDLKTMVAEIERDYLGVAASAPRGDS